jgi:hypothetical protein
MGRRIEQQIDYNLEALKGRLEEHWRERSTLVSIIQSLPTEKHHQFYEMMGWEKRCEYEEGNLVEEAFVEEADATERICDPLPYSSEAKGRAVSLIAQSGDAVVVEVTYNDAITLRVEYNIDTLLGFIKNYIVVSGLRRAWEMQPDGSPRMRIEIPYYKTNEDIQDNYKHISVASYVRGDSDEETLGPLATYARICLEAWRYDSELVEKLARSAESYIRGVMSQNIAFSLNRTIEEAEEWALSADGRISPKRYKELSIMLPYALEARTSKGSKTKYKWDDKEYIRFARKVDDLRELWNKITTYFEQVAYDSACQRSVQHQSWFETASKNCSSVPEDLLKKVFHRQEQRKGSPYLWPIAFAYEHARRECGIDYKYGFDRLDKAYKEGKKLLQNQNGPSSCPI